MPKTQLQQYRRYFIIGLLVSLASVQGITAQTTSCTGILEGNYSIQIDTIHVNIGIVNGYNGAIYDLTGYNTYRLSLLCNAPNDLLQAVSGDSVNPTNLTTTTSFFQEPFFGMATEPNSLLFPLIPELQYDSFLSIGLSQTANTSNGEVGTYIQDDPDGNPILTTFEDIGQDLVLNSFTGGAWFVPDAELATNCTAGSDLAIQFAQVTTDGALDGQFYFQVYKNGLADPQNCIRPYLNLLGLGCTNPTACNFDEFANSDDGSCEFTSCAGCTEPTACNYDEQATLDDGSCATAAEGYDCSGNCLEDIDGDGICDAADTVYDGCNDTDACNYNSLAEANDGSCEYCSCGGPQLVSFADDSLGTYFLEWEIFADHDTTGIAGLEGHKTYRVFIKTAEGLDQVSAAFGSEDIPLVIQTSTDFFHSPLGGLTAESIFPTIYSSYPELPYDSWVTIGIDVASVFAGAGYTAISTAGTWPATFDPGAGAPGGNIVIDDVVGGTWFIIGDSPNGVPDINQRVLLGQFTTDGVISGTMGVQVLPETEPLDDNEYRLSFAFSTAALGVPDESLCGCINDADNDGVCDADEITGCTNPGACNYDATSTTDTDNTLCIFPSGCESCSGASDGTGTVVQNDADNDGVCDADEISGCTDAGACNFDATPTTDTDNTACIYSIGCQTCSGATDGSGTIVENDDDGDGVCNDQETTGCTDPQACNYINDSTTDSDPSACTFATDCNTCSGQTDGTGVVVNGDVDNDGICDDVDDCVGEYDECNVCNGLGPIFECGCLPIIPGECNCNGDVLDALGVCGGSCAADADGDGICDDVDDCVGDYDECGTCNGPGAIFDCGCTGIPEGDCDCSGNQLDACGVCGGTGTDADADGICDDIDNCTDLAACNFSDAANGTCTTLDECGVCGGSGIPEGDCDCNGNQVDALGECGGPCEADIDLDGICDTDEIPGCQDNTACNYNPAATDSDGNCTFTDGLCETCEAGVIVDNAADDDGVCDPNEVAGCQDNTACNYNPAATDSDDSCTFTDGICETCEAGVIVDNDADDDGVCDADEVAGCQDNSACNYKPAATDSDGSCTFTDGLCETCEGGVIVDNDADDDGICDSDETAGCTDPAACNTGDFTDSDNSLCQYTDGICETCEDGVIVDNDADNDGVCDADEVAGCQDNTACNYNSAATDSDGSCTFTDGLCETCEGGVIVDNDADDDGVCDADEVAGCQDNTACNYNPAATDSDDSCTFTDGLCETCEAGVIVDNDADDDGVCDADEVAGCQDNTACNYNPAATDSDDSCLFDDALGICGGICPSDMDSDGICDNEDPCVGQYDALGDCNGGCPADLDNDDICDTVDPCVGALDVLGVCNGGCTADADQDGICDDVDDCVGQYDALGICNGTCTADADLDGVCDSDEIFGCTDGNACNYDAEATEEDDSCEYLDVLDICGGGCAADADNDGICDDIDVCVGSYDALGDCNGNCPADIDGDDICDTEDPCIGSYDALGVCNGDCDADLDGDGVCDTDEIYGCTDENACNFDPSATEEDDSCQQLDALDECGGTCATDADEDGICDDVDDCVGPYDALGVCNGTCTADFDGDGVCDSEEIFGCTDTSACNFNPDATENDDSCAVEDAIGICGGDCPCDQNGNGICDGEELQCPDFNGNGVCDGEEVFGCSYMEACNYDAAVTSDDGSCFYPLPGFDCDGNNLSSDELYYGCTYPQAINYSAAADVDNGSCLFLDVISEIGPCYFDITDDGIVNTPDLLILLQYWESICE